MDQSEKHLTRAEASAFLTERGYPVAPTTLAKYACIGGGPKHRLFGRKPLYLPDELLAWVASRTSAPRQHTSEARAA